MRGFLFDENLPRVPSLQTGLPVTHALDRPARRIGFPHELNLRQGEAAGPVSAFSVSAFCFGVEQCALGLLLARGEFD